VNSLNKYVDNNEIRPLQMKQEESLHAHTARTTRVSDLAESWLFVTARNQFQFQFQGHIME